MGSDPTGRHVPRRVWDYLTAHMDMGDIAVGDADHLVTLVDDVKAQLAAPGAPAWPELDQLWLWLHPADEAALLVAVSLPNGLCLAAPLTQDWFGGLSPVPGPGAARAALQRLMAERAELIGALSRFMRDARRPRPIAELAARFPRGDTPLDTLPHAGTPQAHGRLLKRLQKVGVTTVADLRGWPDARLRELDGFGKACFDLLRQMLTVATGPPRTNPAARIP